MERMFYMVAEAPSFLKRGEQLGIRVAVFNNWDQNIEVCPYERLGAAMY